MTANEAKKTDLTAQVENTVQEPMLDEIEAMKAIVREKFDGSLPADLQCAVHRIFPLWCDGYQSTIPVDDNLSLETIKQSFGGGRYTLKFLDPGGKYVCQRKVHIGGKPKIDGETVDQARVIERERLQELAKSPVQQEDKTLGLIVQMMTQQNSHNLELLKTIMKGQNNAPAPAAAPVQNPLEQMQQYFMLFKEMQGLSGNTDSDSDGMTEIIGKIVDIMGKKKSEEETEKVPLFGQKYLETAAVNTPQTGQVTVETTSHDSNQSQADSNEIEEEDLLVYLQDMEAEETAELMANVFNNADDQKKTKLMEIFLGQSIIEDRNPENVNGGINDDDQEGAGQ
jgi:hypothetical protein